MKAYVKNIHDKSIKGTHWVSLFIVRNKIVFFDSFGIEYIPQEVLNKVRDKSIYLEYNIKNLLCLHFIALLS